MSSFRALFVRELRGLFHSSLGLLGLVLFNAVAAFIFFYKAPPWSFDSVDLNPGFFFYAPIYLMVLAPLLSLRIWADEYRGTMELLLTLPVTVPEIVLSKFAAHIVYLGALFAVSLPLPFTLAYLGSPDWAAIFAGYLALALLGTLFLAVGEFFASIHESPIAGAMTTFLTCYLLYALGLPSWVAVLPHGLDVICERLSVYGPFAEIAAGRLSLSGAFYFLTAILFFLTLTVLRVQMYKWSNPLAAGARRYTRPVLLSFVALLAATYAVNLFFRAMQYGYIDLTSNGQYSLTDLTVNTLNTLPRRVTVRAYFNRTPPPSRELGLAYARTLLDRYRGDADGKLTLEYLDPTQDDQLSTLASHYGVRPEMWQTSGSGTLTQVVCYTTVQVICGDQSELVPVDFQDLGGLENDLTVAIRSVVQIKRPRIVLLEKAPGARPQDQVQRQHGEPGPTEALVMALQRSGRYDLKWLGWRDPIPAGTQLVIVADPVGMPYETAYELQEYVRSGGALFVAASAFTTPAFAERQIALNDLPAAADRRDTGLEMLMIGWGIRFEHGIVVDPAANRSVLLPWKVQARVVNPAAPYAPLLDVRGANLNAASAFTRGQSEVYLDFATPLQLSSQPPTGVTWDWLLRTSPQARLIDLDHVPLQPTAPEMSLDETGSGDQYILAAFGHGTFSAPMRPPLPEKVIKFGAPDGQPWDGKTIRTGSVLFVGSPSILHQNWTLQDGRYIPFQTGPDNPLGLERFATQAINRLAGAQDLLDLRAKDNVNRPITRYANLPEPDRQAAEDRLAWVVITVPLVLLLILGLTQMRLRYTRSNRMAAVSENAATTATTATSPASPAREARKP